ncbi:MAG: glycosyltransferase [Verrucomicrobiaceae bacterium]|nr:MAG: glycosyltransferase [Verrucomicrobiaceae bacterium]
MSRHTIAIILPAYNEELTIVDTMKDFFSVCPDAEIYVIDNASKDRTNALARQAYTDLQCKGRLLEESRKGKAAAVRKALLEINADIYVMVDADLTYPASDLPKLLEPVQQGLADIVCGNRHSSGVYSRENKRPMHDFGNRLVRWLINTLFQGSLQDILTGYRVMSKRFVKNYPILSNGFEIETEMSIHALDKGYSIMELPTEYRDRPEGSFSKLDTFTDGILVLKTIFSIFVKYRPMLFFTLCAILFAVAALAAGSIPVFEYFQTSKVTRFPLAILASGLSILAMLSFAVAVILDSLASAQRFNHALALLHWHDLTRDKG